MTFPSFPAGETMQHISYVELEVNLTDNEDIEAYFVSKYEMN